MFLPNRDKENHMTTKMRYDSGMVKQKLKFILPFLFVALLSACAQPKKEPVAVTVEHSPFNTGSAMIYDGRGMSDTMIGTNVSGTLSTIASSSDVQVFPLEGETANPFAGTRKRRTILENTTSGGYTVLDKNVMVYPLDDSRRPSYLPQFEGPHSNVIQNDIGNEAPLIGTPVDGYGAPGSVVAANNSINRQSAFNSVDDLPKLNIPPKLNMPAPSALKAPSPSPFDLASGQPLIIEGNPNFEMPVTDITPSISDMQPIGTQGGVIRPGGLTGYTSDTTMEPIGSGLTGYQEQRPTTLAEQNRRAEEVKKYTSLASRAGARMDNNLSSTKPVNVSDRWRVPSANVPTGSVSMPEATPIPVPMTAAPSTMQQIAAPVTAPASMPAPFSNAEPIMAPTMMAPVPAQIVPPAAPMPLDGSHNNGAMMQMAPQVSPSDLPPEQPRRNPPSRNGMLTGY